MTSDTELRKQQADMLLQADPVLRECEQALADLVAACEPIAPDGECNDISLMLAFGLAVERARALLAKLRGEEA